MSNVPQKIQELGLTSYDFFKSYGDIKGLLLNNLKSLPNWEEIEKTFSGSGTLELILHLISMSHEIQSFMHLRGVQESYLEFAQLTTSIYAKARELGYRINRPNSPVLKVEYIAIPTITISSGTIIGSWQGLDLVYFGDTKKIESGDFIYFRIGKFKEKSFTFDVNSTTAIIKIISPEDLKYIDNTSTELIYIGEKKDKTIFPEDYIVFEKFADFSESLSDAKLFIADFTLLHGLAKTLEASVSNYSLKYIETDGKINSLDINDVIIDPDYRVVSVDSLGTVGDSPSDIVKNAPLVYSLLRRSITEYDFPFLVGSLPQVKYASVTPYGDSIGIFEINANTLASNNFISINTLVYAYQNIDNLPNNTVLQILYKQLRNDSNIIPELVIEGQNYKIRIYTKSPRLPITVTVSSNLFLVIVQEQVFSKPCIAHIRYVGHNTIDDPVPLTHSEYKDIEAIVDAYKPVGLTLYYEHAVKTSIDLKYVISLSSSNDQVLVQNLVNEIISSYNYSIDTLIDSSDIMNIIERYVNTRYATKLIHYILDASPINIYIDKSHYCKINLLVTFA